jgi:hypothetical protein
MSAAVEIRGREATRKRLQQRVRAGVVPTGSDVEIVAPKLLGDRQ